MKKAATTEGGSQVGDHGQTAVDGEESSSSK